MIRLLLTVLLLWPLTVVAVIGYIQPPAEIISITRELAYSDFPKAADILSIIRIESGFNPEAKNKNSYGVMQVNDGSWELSKNMQQGTNLLREYYIRTGSKKAAIMAYNVGIGNYFRSRLRVSQQEYLMKFNQVRGKYDVEWKISRRSTGVYNHLRGGDDCSSIHKDIPGSSSSILFTLYGLSRSGLQRRRLLSGQPVRYRFAGEIRESLG